MSTAGNHFICEFNKCDVELLNNPVFLEKALHDAAVRSGATVLGSHFHRFEPFGLSGLICLAESHLSIHTWPEHGYAAVDMYTCGNKAHPRRAVQFLKRALGSETVNVIELDRGVEGVDGHYRSRLVGQQGMLPEMKLFNPNDSQIGQEESIKDQKEWVDEFWDEAEGHSFSVEKIIFSGESPYQDIKIIENAVYGKVLLIDANTQSSQFDEHIYHEALIHPTFLAHPNPKNILILGGGEGACVREVLKHRSVEHVTMVDIDHMLVEVCKTYLPEWSDGAFIDPRVSLVIGDAKAWVAASADKFDVIVLDLTDLSDGDTCTPFLGKDFLSAIQQHLNPGGMILMQAGEISDCDDFTHLSVRKTLATIFQHTCSYAQHVPSFFGQWSFIVASDTPIVMPSTAQHVSDLLAKRITKRNRFYNGDTHVRMLSLEPILRKRLPVSGIEVSEETASDFWQQYRKEKAAFLHKHA